MRNPETWQPTKFVIRKNRLYASSDWSRVGVSSRLIAQWTADAYGKHIPEYCRGNLADIGCGLVPMYEYYKPYVSSITAIDWAESVHTNKHLDIIADLNVSPIPNTADESFETVILSDVLEHIYHPRVLLEELHRILKPGGTLLMNVPFCYWIHESPYDYHRYTEFALKRYLAEAGFEMLEFERLGGFIASTITLFSQGLGGIGWGKTGQGGLLKTLVRRPFYPIVAMLQNTICILRNTKPFRFLLQTKSDMLPLGYFIVAQKKYK